MRATFPPGAVDAGALHLAIGRTPQRYMRSVGPQRAYRDIHWRFFVHRSPGWRGGGGEKLTRAMILSAPRGFAQAMIAHVWSGRSGSPDADFLEIDPARGTDSAGAVITRRYNDSERLRWLGKRRSLRPVFADSLVGRWQCVEVYVRLNDPGERNGDFRLWVDGTEEANRTALDWVGPYTEYGINAIYLENYWNSGAVTAQARTFDNFIVSTARVGCGPR